MPVPVILFSLSDLLDARRSRNLKSSDDRKAMHNVGHLHPDQRFVLFSILDELDSQCDMHDLVLEWSFDDCCKNDTELLMQKKEVREQRLQKKIRQETESVIKMDRFMRRKIRNQRRGHQLSEEDRDYYANLKNRMLTLSFDIIQYTMDIEMISDLLKMRARMSRENEE